MNTFLEKVMRSPKAASRIAAASAISEARSRVRYSLRDMTVTPVGRMLGEQCEIGGRVDVTREAGTLHDRGLDALGARLLGMQRRARLSGREGEADDGWRSQQHGV